MTVRDPSRHEALTAPAPQPPPHRRTILVGVLAGAALVALSVGVGAGGTVALDDWARELFRPGDEWGRLQIQVDVIVEGLRPRNTLALLALVSALAALWHRAWWPVGRVAVVGGAGIAMTLALKAVVGRADTHGELGTLGGSYPSGHVVALLLLAGCTALLLWEHPGRLAWSLVGAMGLVMAWALMVQTAHWLTDVVGAVLIGVVVLSAAHRMPVRRAGRSPSARP